MLPEVQAILEEVQEGTALHGRLALLAAGLADAEAQLGEQNPGRGAVRYDMYDGDSQEGDWEEGRRRGPEDVGGKQQGEGPGGGNRDGKPAEWKPEGPGRWSRACRPGEGKQQPQPRQAAGAAAQSTSQSAGGRGEEDGTAAAGGKEKASGGPSAKGDDTTGRTDGDDETGTRAGKLRRRQPEAEAEEEERRASDARRAQELRVQLEYAAAAQVQSYRDGNGGFRFEAALSVAAQNFVSDVQRAQAQASEMGIEPRAADGRTLLELSPMELRQWVEENLEEGSMQD